MPILFRDIETRSVIDLKKVGAVKYASDPTTSVWCVGYAIDDGLAEIWIPGQPIPEAFITAARNPDWLIVAHNDAFERAIEESDPSSTLRLAARFDRAPSLHDGNGFRLRPARRARESDRGARLVDW